MGTVSTIAALATPHGVAALAVIRVSGPESFSIIQSCLKKTDKFNNAKPRFCCLYRFFNKKGPIDLVSIIKYVSPKSYTGENLVEIICHGGMAVVEQILETLLDAGVEYARPGEFTKRAFLNGKTDLVRAEATGQIISSRTSAGYQAAIASYFGGYSIILNQWREEIESILCDIESVIEFSDQDDIHVKRNDNERTHKIVTIKKQIEKELEKRQHIKDVDDGIHIAIAGIPNAGKSTLLNLILGYERSIVFPEEGTTRDAVSEWVRWQGMDVKFIDCAGLRNTRIKIEQIGVERSWQLIDNSELVILVTPTNEELKSEEYEVVKRRKNKGGILGIINKTDLGQDKGKQEFFKTNNIPFISISAIIQDQRNTIQNFLMKTLEDKRSDIEYGSIVCTPRQETILRKVIYYLSEMESAGKDQEEILAEYGRKIQEQLDDFTGKCTSEDIINSIFQKFCIGK